MKTCVLATALVAVVLLAVGAPGCSRRIDPAPRGDAKQVVVWHALGSWSGRGSRQTESVTSDSGAMRVRWTAVNKDGGAPGGHFRVAAHSAISGRFLEQAVDHDGPGSGVGFVNQDPRVFYFVVESDRLDWTFSVEEAIAGTVTGR
jgi:hypothetical protein